MVVKGQCLWRVSSGGLGYSVGDILYALTCTTTGNTNSATGGRADRYVGTFTVTQVTDGTLGSVVFNRVGRALSALTTGQSATGQLLTDVDLY
jgi:hypothetical protein